MRVVDDHIDRLWKLREQATSFADIAAIEAAIAALSHAAGQDGEQCRAASVSWGGYEAFEQFLAAEIDSAPEALRRLGDWLCNVLDEDHFATANRMVIGAMMETSAAIRALSRGVPEDTKRLDWVLENAAMVETDGGGQWRVRFDWTAPIMYFSYRDTPRHAIDAAIADQRKEG